MLKSNLDKLICNNFVIKFIPQINIIKLQRISSSTINNYNYIYYTRNNLINLIYMKKDFLFIPSQIISYDNNYWFNNQKKNLIWRPNSQIENMIEIYLSNNNIYLHKDKHPDIYQPAILNDKYDSIYNLISYDFNILKKNQLELFI